MFVFIKLLLDCFFDLVFSLCFLLSVFFFFVIGHFACRHILILGAMVSLASSRVSSVLSIIVARLSATHVRSAHIFSIESHHSVFVVSFIATGNFRYLAVIVIRVIITLIVSIITSSLRLSA